MVQGGGLIGLVRSLGGVMGCCGSSCCAPERLMGGPGGAGASPTWEQRQACPKAKPVRPACSILSDRPASGMETSGG